MSSTDARNSEDEGIFEDFVDFMKQRGQSFAINDHSAEVIFVIGKRLHTNEIISIAAGDKIISWWKSVQILVRRLDENVCDCRRIGISGITLQEFVHS